MPFHLPLGSKELVQTTELWIGSRVMGFHVSTKQPLAVWTGAMSLTSLGSPSE